MLCHVLSPPSASEPENPVLRTANEVLVTAIATSTPPPAPPANGNSMPSGKEDTKSMADASGKTHEVAKKTFCN